MTLRSIIGLSGLVLGCAQSPTALQQLEASCDTAAECSDWNTAQRNSCKDDYRDQVTDAERVGCGRQLNEFTDCIIERARCQAGVFTSGGCAAEQTSLNNCIAGGGGSCGDGTCGPGESNATCPADCTTTATCGDGACNGGETNATCAADCTGTANVAGCTSRCIQCGDGTPAQTQFCGQVCGAAPAACVNCLANVVACEDGASCPCGD